MATNRNDPRHEGFKAGGFFGGSCPYAPGSQEAAAWERGWVEGSMKREGARWRRPSASLRWQPLLQKLRNVIPLPR